MANRLESDVLPQESGNHKEQVKSFIESFLDKDRNLLEQYIQLPNQPDTQPEVMRLVKQYGKEFVRVTD